MAEIRLDHIVVAAASLAEGRDWVEGLLGVAAAGGGRHETMGTHNALWGLGESYLEVIAVDPPLPYCNAEHYDPAHFRATTPYPEIALEELAALQLPAAQDCILWLWTTHRFMPDAFALLRAWDSSTRWS